MVGDVSEGIVSKSEEVNRLNKRLDYTRIIYLQIEKALMMIKISYMM